LRHWQEYIYKTRGRTQLIRCYPGWLLPRCNPLRCQLDTHVFQSPGYSLILKDVRERLVGLGLDLLNSLLDVLLHVAGDIGNGLVLVHLVHGNAGHLNDSHNGEEEVDGSEARGVEKAKVSWQT
jgi:hypothetical protein